MTEHWWYVSLAPVGRRGWYGATCVRAASEAQAVGRALYAGLLPLGVSVSALAVGMGADVPPDDFVGKLVTDRKRVEAAFGPVNVVPGS